MIGLAFLATVINYLDRQTLSVACSVDHQRIPDEQRELRLVVACFMVAYTLGTAFRDRCWTTGMRGWAMRLCIAWWSTATVLHVPDPGAVELGLCAVFCWA